MLYHNVHKVSSVERATVVMAAARGLRTACLYYNGETKRKDEVQFFERSTKVTPPLPVDSRDTWHVVYRVPL